MSANDPKRTKTKLRPLGMPFRSEAISMINQRIWLGELLECRGIVNDDVAP